MSSRVLEQAAAAKRTKYPQRLFDSMTLFMPFAIEDFGHIGDAGWAVLKQLAAYAAANTAGGHRDFRLGMTEASPDGSSGSPTQSDTVFVALLHCSCAASATPPL